jgi:hypothetical protein
MVDAGCGSGVGVGLAPDARQILHVHSDRQAELCLTRTAIDRLRPALAESGTVGGTVDQASDGDWASFQLDTEHDVELLLTLLSVALKAHSSDTGRPLPPCSVQSAAQGLTPGAARPRRRPRFTVRPRRS